MGSSSKIEWTDASWTVVQGCDYASPGCANCYAASLIWRQMHNPNEKVSGPLQGLVEKRSGRPRWTGKVSLRYDRLDWPLKWREPRMIFVPSVGDLFHENVPDEFIAECYAVMAVASWHTFQNLTKRPERRRALLTSKEFRAQVMFVAASRQPGKVTSFDWPLPNVWEGTSAENERQLNLRAPILASTPAAVRFLSLEPWLDFGPVDMQHAFSAISDEYPERPIHWVIVGGESAGPDYRRMVQLCHGDWLPKPEALEAVRSIRDDCQQYGVAFFFKQWGGPKSDSGGRLLDGRTWDELPLARPGG